MTDRSRHERGSGDTGGARLRPAGSVYGLTRFQLGGGSSSAASASARLRAWARICWRDMPNCWRNRRAMCEHGQRHRPDRSAPSWRWCRSGSSPPRLAVPGHACHSPGARSARPRPRWHRLYQLAEHRALAGQLQPSGLVTGPGQQRVQQPVIHQLPQRHAVRLPRVWGFPRPEAGFPVVTGCPPATLRLAQRYRPQHGGPGFSSVAVSPGSDLLDSFVEDPPSALVFMGKDGACCSQVGGVVDQLGRRIQVAGREARAGEVLA
jgi:hypothetical protein